VQCMEGTYLLNNTCRICPRDMTTIGQGTPDLNGCVCESGFLALGGACVTEPQGLEAAALNTSVERLTARAGFWRPGYQTITAKRCPYPSTCINGTTPNAVHSQSSSATCAVGLSGAFCTRCQKARSYFDGSSCQDCGASQFRAVVLAIVVALLLFALYRARCLRRIVAGHVSIRGKLKICIGFYQIVTQLPHVYDFSYPAQYSNLINAFAIVNMHLFAWLPGLQSMCLGLQSLVDELLFAVVAPLGVVLVFGAVLLLQRKPLVTALPFVLYWSFLIYPSVASRGFRALATCNCFAYLDGSRDCFLRDHLTELCTFGQRPWPRPEVVGVATVAVACYGVGVPLLYASLLCWRAGAIGAAVTFLTVDYEPRARWWELVEVFKKLVFTGFLALLDPGSLVQMYTAVAVSLVAVVLQVYVAPYRRAADNVLAMISDVALAFTLLGTLALETTARTASPLANSDAILAVLMAAALVVVLAALTSFVEDVRSARTSSFLLVATGQPPSLELQLGKKWHLFLSHNWDNQDAAAVVKRQLNALLQGVRIFVRPRTPQPLTHNPIPQLSAIGSRPRYVYVRRSWT
jgi:hypothetical protein